MLLLSLSLALAAPTTTPCAANELSPQDYPFYAKAVETFGQPSSCRKAPTKAGSNALSVHVIFGDLATFDIESPGKGGTQTLKVMKKFPSRAWLADLLKADWDITAHEPTGASETYTYAYGKVIVTYAAGHIVGVTDNQPDPSK